MGLQMNVHMYIYRAVIGICIEKKIVKLKGITYSFKLSRQRYEVLFSEETLGEGHGARGNDVTADGVNNCAVEHTCWGKKIKRNAI